MSKSLCIRCKRRKVWKIHEKFKLCRNCFRAEARPIYPQINEPKSED